MGALRTPLRSRPATDKAKNLHIPSRLAPRATHAQVSEFPHGLEGMRA
jgi:hypothetical protein